MVRKEDENISLGRGLWRRFQDVGGAARCFLQDDAGDIWIGTNSGVSLWDTQEFQDVRLGAEPPIDVFCLLRDSRKNVWAGTDAGLFRFDGKKFAQLGRTEGLLADRAYAVYEDSDQILWVGTETGLFRFDGRRFAAMSDKGMAWKPVLAIAADGEGNLWAGGEAGLFRDIGGSVRNVSADIRVSALCCGPDGDIWVGTARSGLFRWAPDGTGRSVDFGPAGKRHVLHLITDREGNVWGGTAGGGALCCVEGNTFSLTTDHGLPNNDVYGIMQDREGSLWFACFYGGIVLYRPSDFRVISDECVQEVMAQTGDGCILWGRGPDLSEFDGKAVRRHLLSAHVSPDPTVYSPPNVFDILEDSQGRIWVATSTWGLFCYETREDLERDRPRVYSPEHGLPDRHAFKVVEDRHGNIWIGGYLSLMRYNESGIERVAGSAEIGCSVVSALHADAAGVLWMGGWSSGGITRYDGEKFRRYAAADGLPGSKTTCVLSDREGRVWIGTDVGLSCFDGQSFTNYTMADGLAARFVERITEDSHGNLWIATLGGGITRYDGMEFQVLAERDGLLSNCVSGVIPAPDGSVFIATYRGVCQYFPDRRTAPGIRIDEVDTGRRRKHPKTVRLTTAALAVRIRYHALSSKTARMRYRYILEGHDKDWRGTWANEVTYPSLPVGKYTFKVVAVDRDFVQSEQPAVLRLTVEHDPRDEMITELELRVRERTRELEAALDYADNVITSMGDTLVVLNPDLTIRTVNPALLGLVGRTREELLGQSMDILLPRRERRLLAGLADEEPERGVAPFRLENVETAYVTSDGTPIPVLLSITALLDAGGDLLGAVCVASNLTETKRAEEERRRLEERIQYAQKLESLGILAGGIAHDFNNLLVGVLGNAELLREDMPQTSPLRDRADDIIASAKRAAELSRQMLAYSGQGRFVVEAVDLSKVVLELWELLTATVSRRIRINRVLEPGLDVECDPSQLRQILMNLVTNAAEAIGDGEGTIEVRTGSMRCDEAYLSGADVTGALTSRTYAFLAVYDSGCGMDESTRRRIFDPFFTTKFLGRGLGLAAAMGIVRGHQGALKVYTEPGKGSCFRVLLPLATRASEPDSEEEDDHDAPVGSGLVMLADDEESVLKLGEEYLRRFGFDVVTARDGVDAVEVFRKHADEIVAVLLDVTMPRMSGAEALNEIRAIRSEVPILLSSGYSEQIAGVALTDRQAVGFIQKPYERSALRRKLREILNFETGR